MEEFTIRNEITYFKPNEIEDYTIYEAKTFSEAMMDQEKTGIDYEDCKFNFLFH